MNPIKFLPVAIVLISISSVMQWCSLPIGNTFIWWLLDAIILYCLFKLKPRGYNILPINLFLLCVGVSFVYGAVGQTENYWDWKLLVGNLMVFMLPLAAYAFSNPQLLKKVLKSWLKYAWIILVLLMPFLGSDAYGRFLVPCSFLGLFMALLTKKKLAIVLIAYVMTLILGQESRSDSLKFTVCLFLGIVLYVPLLRTIFYSSKKFILYTLWILPIFLFFLGATGTFNIFKIEEEFGLEGKYTMKSSASGPEEISALADTRTFLYVEEISSALRHNYVLQGRSMARGYDSVSFGDGIDRILGVKRGERGSCETSILNIFNYFGLIGVVLYFVIFATASYKAVIHSNNIYVQAVGIYVAFRWLFGWVEDFSRFDLNYLFLWIMIGMCYSPFYRRMTNDEFKQWITK